MVDRKNARPAAAPAAGRAAIIAAVLGAAAGAHAPFAAAQAQADGPTQVAGSISSLKALSIEDLMKTEVTSVSKAAEPLSDAPAAIYVITHEDILRSGAQSLPDMLRLAPNLQVAQITTSSYAISARGFNGSASSKLLVLIDGRSIYTPYHSGVPWDIQDVLPQDVERIEVISGPGATLWGANAVNGVINIVTRRSYDTQGPSADVGGGNLEQRASAQYGGEVNDALHYRAYVDSLHYDEDQRPGGGGAQDAHRMTQGGFRTDWTPLGELLTLQGDFYQGSEDGAGVPREDILGQNVLGRWTHSFADGAALQVQAYYDHQLQSEPGVGEDDLHTYDLYLQHSFSWGARQNIVWGGEYRIQHDDFPIITTATQPLYFRPQDRRLTLGSVFGQDTFALTEALKLTLGMKLEDEPYTGIEPLPSGRLSWKLSDNNLLWAAISRAVRAPSRLDRDLFENIGPLNVIAGGDFQPEELTAYEAGYRTQPTSRSSISISTFYNVYDDLRTAEFSPGGQLPVSFANQMAGHTYGAEIWGSYQLLTWWRLDAGASGLHKDLHFRPGSSQIGGLALAGNDPSYQVLLRSSMLFASRGVFDLSVRQIGPLPDPASPAYTEVDARVAWRIVPSLELSLKGSNLIHPQHLEFGTSMAPLQLGSTGVETGRAWYLEVRWRPST
ncbi:MAG TPA: TonB-dependent receptor [Steroidobacteraceae bacterium]|nr:TonB-dependent receptor [Steroidobacteraceae bacterium]